MNIDVKLILLVMKYGIYTPIPETLEMYKPEVFKYLINKLVSDIDGDIAIRGGGEATSAFINVLENANVSKIKAIIDQNSYIDSIEGIQIVSPEEIKKTKITTVIIPSLKFRRDFLTEFYNTDLKVIDVYDYFAEFGIICDHEFFVHEYKIGAHKIYIDVNNSLKKLKDATDNLERRYYQQKLIAELIEIRDFISAEKQICDYIWNGFDTDKRYSFFKEELEELLKKIEDTLNDRKNDIVIYWLDNVNNEDFLHSEFAKKLINSADTSVCKNAYTFTPWTRLTFFSILTGKRPIEDKTFLIKKLSESNSLVLKMCEQYDYDFKYIANPGMFQVAFDAGKLPKYPAEYFEHPNVIKRTFSDCSTRLQWISLKNRMISPKPVCHFIHCLSETHAPYIYTGVGEMNLDERSYKNQLKYRNEGKEFLLRQVEWYTKKFNKEGYKIYLSDHGESLLYKRAYEKQRSNIILAIQGRGLPTIGKDCFYSHLNFNKLLKAIISKDFSSWDEIFKLSIEFENLDFYDKRVIEMHILRWLSGESDVDMANFQCRGVRTQKDMYVRYANGKELYFRLPDEKNNYINNSKWTGRIEKLREMTTDNFIDINEESSFKHSYMLYDFLKLMYKKNPEKIVW